MLEIERMLLSVEAIQDYRDLNKRKEEEALYAEINERSLRDGVSAEELLEMTFHAWKFRAAVLALDPWTGEAVYMPGEKTHIKLFAMNPGFERGNQWMHAFFYPPVEWPDAHPVADTITYTTASLVRDTREENNDYHFKRSINFLRPGSRFRGSVETPCFEHDRKKCGYVYRKIWDVHANAPLMYDRGMRVKFDRNILYSTKG